MHRFVVVAALCAALVLGWTPSARAAGGAGVAPVAGPVVGDFAPPEVKWGSGHRGVDIAAEPGSVVVAPAAGVVSFAGIIAGRPVLVVDHGGTRSTLEPVSATVQVGARVAAGQPVGLLSPGHACAAPACLHWGLKRDEQYLDPLSLLSPSEVRLLPDDAVGGVRQRAASRAAALAAVGVLDGADTGVAGSGVLLRPVAARITSPFGMRLHPIFKEWRLHAGVDLSAPCGTPIRAAADGVVRHVGFDSSGGWRLVVDHGSVDGTPLVTTYLHAQGYRVRSGTHVARGEVVGTVGSTGWSTGCHLHFSVKQAGRQVDPQPWLE